MGRPKLVLSLDGVYTCTKMFLIFVPGDTIIGYRGCPADADGPKTADYVPQVPQKDFKELG